jgi:DNA-binding winged helix-turn-helix (wHTH) protein/TolB-like protein
MKASFGDFEFETATGELRRHGEPVRLQSQPARVLAVLIDSAGQVVTRETLRDAVWGAETFVDFDKGLNFAIAQVRAALEDSADSPSFIRTLPKRGYQFIAPVTRLDRPATDTASRARPKLLRLGTVVAAALALISGVWLWRSNASRPSDPAHTIVVIPFDNETGVGDLDRYARNLSDSLVAQLVTSARDRFDVIGNALVLRAPRSQRDLVAIADSVKAGYVVIGQVQRDGAHLRVLAHLIRVPDQKHLWVVRLERPADGALIPAMDAALQISSEFLGKL